MTALLTPPPEGPSPDYRKRSFFKTPPPLDSLGLIDLLPDVGMEAESPEPPRYSTVEAPAIETPPSLESLGLLDLTKDVEPPPAVSNEYLPLAEVPQENKLGQSIANWRGIHQKYGGSGASPADALYWLDRVPFAGAVSETVGAVASAAAVPTASHTDYG